MNRSLAWGFAAGCFFILGLTQAVLGNAWTALFDMGLLAIYVSFGWSDHDGS